MLYEVITRRRGIRSGNTKNIGPLCIPIGRRAPRRGVGTVAVRLDLHPPGHGKRACDISHFGGQLHAVRRDIVRVQPAILLQRVQGFIDIDITTSRYITMNHPVGRITSYNVCYTKLLRALSKS